MSDVRPFFVPDESSVRAAGWQRYVDGDWEILPPYLDDWDQRTTLQLQCSITCDPNEIRRASHLTDGSALAWSVGWRVKDTGLVSAMQILPMLEPSVSITLVVPPDRAGSSLVLTRRLVLTQDRSRIGSTEAYQAGSILWDDSTKVRLTGSGSAFPIEIIDFGHLHRDKRASWYLDLPTEVDVPAMGSLLLLINAADSELVEAVSKTRRQSDYQRALVQSMEEGVVEEFVRWAVAHWAELEDVDEESVGAAGRNLANRVLADPSTWAKADQVDSMALRSEIVSGARAIDFGRPLG